jgi:anaerobic selenocysteine-containing dehydrogenase
MHLSRRGLLKQLALAAGATAMLPTFRVEAEDLPHLDVKDPAAIALGYVEKAEQADKKKFASYEKGSSCANCSQLQGTEGAAYRPCALFAGKSVSVAGWCSGWAPEI